MTLYCLYMIIIWIILSIYAIFIARKHNKIAIEKPYKNSPIGISDVIMTILLLALFSIMRLPLSVFLILFKCIGKAIEAKEESYKFILTKTLLDFMKDWS